MPGEGDDEDVLRALIDRMPDAVSVYDLDARARYLNPAAARTFGCTVASLAGRSLWEAFPEAIGNPFHRAFERVAAGGPPEELEHYYPATEQWFAKRVERIGDHVHVIARDMTAEMRRRRRLEAIAQISTLLTSDERDPIALQAVAEVLAGVLDAQCSVALLSEDRRWLEVAARAAADAASLELTAAVTRWAADAGSTGEALRTRTVVLDDGATALVRAATLADPALRDAVRRYDPTSVLSAPLIVDDEVIGALIASRRGDAPPLASEDLALFTEIAPTVGLYLGHARRRAEAARLRDRLATVADATPALVGFVDRDERFRYVNASYERWFGRPRGWFLGRSVAELLGEEGYRESAPHLRRALAGEPVRFRRVAASASGDRHVDAHYVPIRDTTGAVEGIVVTVLDVTAEVQLAAHERARLDAERRATRRLESLLAVTGKLAGAHTADEIARVVVDEGVGALGADLGAIWLVSGDGEELVLERHRGYAPEHLAAYGRQAARGDGPLQDCFTTAQAVWVGSCAEYAARYPAFAARHALDPALPLAFAMLPLVIEGRAVGCLNVTFHDERRLTADERAYLDVLASHAAEALHRARLYEEARAARQQAEAASRAKDQFLAMLGHELRNPLAPITTALHLMRLRGPDQLERERAVIERQVAHLSRLVDDLLDISRITRGKIELRRERTSLAPVVARAIEIASPLLEQRRHRLAVEVPPDLAVHGDPVRLGQVVANLLSNAAKYTESGGHVEVRAARHGDDVELIVRDDGIGIAPEMLPRIFEMFVQAPQPSARADGGLGLGLAIVKSLVELHGGRVAARSDGLGRGAELVVTLPAAPAAPARRAADLAGVARAAIARRVLVVDDNEDAATLIGEAIGLRGHEIRIAGDGPSALRVAAEFHPEIAVLDIGLPVMDGYELAGRLRAAPALGTLRLIAVSGYGQDEDRARSHAAGFEAHLAKPVTVEALVRLIEA